MHHPDAPKQPGRGGMILTLGILSLVVCAVLGPIAWYMANQDLAGIESGRVDDRDRAIVQGGLVCGIISTCILGLYVLGFAIFLAVVWIGLMTGGGLL